MTVPLAWRQAVRVVKALPGTVLLGFALSGLPGCAHGTGGAQYAVLDGSLVAGRDALIDLGPPAATYDRSLVTRGGSQSLVHESFTNHKRVLVVELLPGRKAGRVVSVHRNLMALDALGRPTWSGVEILDSGLVLDEGVWDKAFRITDSLPAGEPDTSWSLPGTTISIRTFKDGVAVGEGRMFSPTAPEASIDVGQLGSTTRCSGGVTTGSQQRVEAAGFERLEPGSRAVLAEGRSAGLKVHDGHVELHESGRVERLSSLDFADTHVLAADVTRDGVRDLLVEVIPSTAGSCYELWSSSADGYTRHEDLFCNPTLSSDGTLVSHERDGPYSRVKEYEPDHNGTLHWVRKQEPLSPDFSRYERLHRDGSVDRSVIYLGLPECGDARVTAPHPLRVSIEPGGTASWTLAGELRVLDVQVPMPREEWVLVTTQEGARGWLRPAQLGDLETASRLQCAAATD